MPDMEFINTDVDVYSDNTDFIGKNINPIPVPEKKANRLCSVSSRPQVNEMSRPADGHCMRKAQWP